MIQYTLKLSQRKSIRIIITKNATIEVRAPRLLPIAEIEKIVLSKRDWIIKHLNARIDSVSKKDTFSLCYGALLPLQGNYYPIVGKIGNEVGFDGACFYIPLNLQPDEIKNTVVQIYKHMAKLILEMKTEEYAKKMHLTPSAIKINSAKTRWGSCSEKNSINYTWRLVMADNAVIDYVVVHELAHIKELNHSSRFWNLVAAFIPDYRLRRVGLKELHKKLLEQNWD